MPIYKLKEEQLNSIWKMEFINSAKPSHSLLAFSKMELLSKAILFMNIKTKKL